MAGYSACSVVTRFRAAWAIVALLVATVASSPAGLAWREGVGSRWAELPAPPSGTVGFTLVPAQTSGIQFTNRLADRTVAFNRVLENGSGVALGDVDGDGWCDLYFCQLEGPNALYRNLGNWRFEDVTAQARVACPNQYSTGAVFADTDGDGDLDLLVNSIGGGTRAFLNDGKGRFEELTGTRLVRRFGSTSMSLADIDGDGDLDLYVTNYRTDTYKDRPRGLKVEAAMVDGKIVVTPADRFIPVAPRSGGVEVIELGERDFFYLNDGKGRFLPVSWTSGAFVDEDGQALKGPPLDWGLTAAFRDLNGDGAPDLYVCNDFFYSPDRFWLNQPGRGFRALPRTAARNMSMSSMAIDVADINRDGFDDFIVMDMLSRSHEKRHRQRPNMMKGLITTPVADPGFRPEVPRNTLFLSRGDGTFAEIAQLSGVAATEWSWSAMFLDVDLDGYEDLLIGTGNTRDVQDADVLEQIARIRDAESPEARLQRFPSLATENIALRNRADLTFEDVSARWGFNTPGVSQGMAAADLDNDGDLDVVINNLNAAPGLYRNEAGAARVAVRLKGLPPNTHGIGAKIRVSGGPAPQSQEMICGSRYVSCDDTIRVFAAGAAANRLKIEVAWRSGWRSVLDGARANAIYEFAESDATPPGVPQAAPQPAAAKWFEDASALLGYTHHDEPFDDFARQPLLSRRLSQLGPGTAWIDFDQDGWDDLVIGAGRGGRLALFKNTGKGTFTPNRAFEAAARDQTTVVGWPRSPSETLILAGASNYEEGATNASPVRVYDPGTGTGVDLLPPQWESVGPVALADLEGNGALALFTGGRVAPGRYPEAVSSHLYRQVSGRLAEDPASKTALERVGLVSGAVFTDLNGDGRPELVLACDWGPVRVFQTSAGQLAEATAELGLGGYLGWWTSVSAGDFDGDGRLDLVACNWGRNTKYQPFLREPINVFYWSEARSPWVQLLEGYSDPDLRQVVPWRDLESVAQTLPFIRASFPTFRAYSHASIPQLLGPVSGATREWKATTLDSMVFLNRGGRFEPRPLPIEAQFAPAFGVTVADFDGDGREDLFLAQNFFGVEPETSRYDGGRGLCLRGDGQGNFTATPGQVSGIEIYGEQRGCAAADYDGDGRTDLVVAQNSGPAKLYRNTLAQPGVRLRLKGPSGNPTGIGAVVRLKSGGVFGPAREIHAGSGYWSQDTATPVLAAPWRPLEVWVRWPGGKISLARIGEKTGEVTVSFQP